MRVARDHRLHTRDFELAARDPDEHADRSAEDRHHHGLGQELAENLAAARADRLADADLARALVTRTSMMFITPMPPMSSEMAATSPSSVVKTSWWSWRLEGSSPG